MWRGTRAQLAFALGGAILNMLPHWRTLVFASDRDLYFSAEPTSGDYFAALLWMSLIFAALFVAARFIARWPGRLAGWAMSALAVATAFNGIDYLRISYFQSIYQALPLWAWAGIASVLLAAAVGAAWRGLLGAERVATACTIAVAVFSPFALSTAGQGVLRALTAGSAPKPALSAAAPGPAERRLTTRVAWIIFDELDRRKLTQPDAPYAYQNFAALRAHAIDFSSARPPGGRTDRAMPSYWIGQRVLESRARGADEIELVVEPDGEGVVLSRFETLFDGLAQRGVRSGVVGFYHPYCRLFASQLDRCVGYFLLTPYYRESEGFIDSFLHAPMSFYPGWRGRVFVDVFLRNRESAIEMLSDPELDFVMVHHSLPHSPAIYDVETQQLQARAARIEGNYFLADRTLGEFVAGMRQSGVLDRTALVVGADHGSGLLDGWDSEAGAVPLIVKLPGYDEGLEVDAPVDTVSTASLILGLLDGSVSTPEDVTALLVQPAERSQARLGR